MGVIKLCMLLTCGMNPQIRPRLLGRGWLKMVTWPESSWRNPTKHDRSVVFLNNCHTNCWVRLGFKSIHVHDCTIHAYFAKFAKLHRAYALLITSYLASQLCILQICETHVSCKGFTKYDFANLHKHFCYPPFQI